MLLDIIKMVSFHEGNFIFSGKSYKQVALDFAEIIIKIFF